MENADEKKYKMAQQRVADIKKFYSDLIAYVVVNVILFIIDSLPHQEIGGFTGLL